MKLLTKLHEDGWLITLLLMALVVMGGAWTLWRASAQEQQIREMRTAVMRLNVMLYERTQRFDRIEAGQQRILDELRHDHVPEPAILR